MHDPVLYSVSPEYRRVVDLLFRAESYLGALESAYRNALAERQQAKDDFKQLARAAGTAVADRFLAKERDNPGRGGSGGAPAVPIF